MAFKKGFRVHAMHQRKKTTARAQQSTVLRRLTKWGGILLGVAALGILLRTWLVLILLNVLTVALGGWLPPIDDRDALVAHQSTIIYDRDGAELYTIHGDENRFEIPLLKMPESIVLATIAAEDDRFYAHPGFDVDGIIRAMLFEVFGIGRPSGGSTITQQFVKNAYLTNERSYERKMKELLLATKLENRFSKDEILEMYLNRIPYGSNSFGVQAAAETFFAKNAEELTLAESAILAGLPQAPSRYSPYGANRDLLLGYCDTGDAFALPDDLSVTLTATGTVWLRVTTDGSVAVEQTLRASDTLDLPFEVDFSILHGNGNLEISVAGNGLPLAGIAQTAVTTSYTREAIAERVGASLTATEGCATASDPRYVPGRADYVLGRLRTLSFISDDEYQAAWDEIRTISFQKYREPIAHPHFVFYVREELEKRYGQDVVAQGGLRVFTTLDPALQTEAQRLVSGSFPSERVGDDVRWSPNRFGATNAATLAMDIQTGQILAMVGSRDYFEVVGEDGTGNDGATNLTTRPRQPGSSFKPIAYAAGFLASGMTPASVLWDVDTKFGTEEYNPQNFDGEFMGPLSVRTALQYSRNVPAVKAAILAGEAAVVDLAKNLGITRLLDDGSYGPTIALGAGEVTMLEMVTAYSAFANAGQPVQPVAILKVTDARGNVIDEWEEPSYLPQALDPATAYLVTDILADRDARPAGWNPTLAPLSSPVAAKTGTANKKDPDDPTGEDILPGDTWTVGYTPQVVAAAWMGNNDGTPMNLSGTGLGSAGPIWSGVMRAAHQGLPAEGFARPDDVVQREVSRLTGSLPGSDTPARLTATELFAQWNVPLTVDDSYTTVAVDSISGKLPTAYTPEESIEDKVFLNMQSQRPWDTDWQDPVTDWVTANAGVLAERYGLTDGLTLALPPTEEDDVHTAETAARGPSVSITAPVSQTTVSTGMLGVWVDVAAPHGVARVEYYLGDELVDTAFAAPWSGSVPVPVSLQDGAQITISAQVHDELGYASTSRVLLRIGQDTQAPTVRITSPQAGAQVARGTTLLVQAEAFDAGSRIDEVRFSLDGRELATETSAPYSTRLTVDDSVSLGTHRISVSATDATGRSVSQSVTFSVVTEVSAPTTQAGAPTGTEAIDTSLIAITSPVAGSRFPSGTAALAITGQADRAGLSVDTLDLVARNTAGGGYEVVATLDQLQSDVFQLTWLVSTPSTYELYLRAKTTTGETVTSGRVEVTVE